MNVAQIDTPFLRRYLHDPKSPKAVKNQVYAELLRRKHKARNKRHGLHKVSALQG